MADFELLAPGGHQKLVDEVVDRLDLKADIDGYYAQLTAGAADNLTGRGDATTAEFLYRTAGGTADIETGQAVAKSVKGNTLVWNQLVAASDGSVSQTVNGVTWAKNNDGSVTVSGTPTANGNLSIKMIPSGSIPSGHKVLVRNACPAGGSSSTYYAGIGGFVADTGSGGIMTFDTTATTYFRFDYRNGATIPETKLWPQLFDLTQMFGAGNEPATVAEFEALFPEPYYPYDAGSLLPVRMEGVETVGFNQWDEQWRLGSYNTSGAFVTGYDFVANTNPIRVLPNTTYCCTAGIWRWEYDADGAYLGVSAQTSANGTFTTGASTNFICFRTSAQATTCNHDICINLSWSGRRNGEYEPFWSAQREIAASTYFPDGMRSAGSVYDELTSTEAIQRVGVVDLGTLTWNVSTDQIGQYFYADKLDMLSVSSISDIANLTCAKYPSTSSGNVYDKSIAEGSGTSHRIYVRDTTYNDAVTFKTAMSGVMLHYPLATPTVTPIDPALNLSYRVDDFGTERIMVPENERSAPPVLDIAYGLNVVDFVRRAPTEYISAASFRQYLLARDAHDGTTTTMTWDDTDNRYEFAITDTVTEG